MSFSTRSSTQAAAMARFPDDRFRGDSEDFFGHWGLVPWGHGYCRGPGRLYLHGSEQQLHAPHGQILRGASSREIGDPLNVLAMLSGCCDVAFATMRRTVYRNANNFSAICRRTAWKIRPGLTSGDDPDRQGEELLELVPVDSSKPYSMYKSDFARRG